MKRNAFNILATCVWVCMLMLGIYYWKQILRLTEEMLPQLGHMAFPVFVSSVFVIGIFIQAKLAERFAPKEIVLDRNLPAAERRRRAIREATVAIKRGRIATAIAVYEDAGMLEQALKLAQDSGEKPSLARLLTRMGLHSRACHLYLQLKDYELAAQVSVLMGKIAQAHDYYKQAAEAVKGTVPEVREAELWERAGDRATAASLYEKATELERAAECYHLLGNEKRAIRLAERAKAMLAFELKQRGETRQLRERQADFEEAKATTVAKELKAKGDLLGAGILYRKAGNMLEAAMAFERFEEWERAAEAYEKAGLKDRADLARMHIEPKEPVVEEEAAAEGPAVIPTPAAALPVAFEPIARARAVPVYLGITGVPPSSPEVRKEVCKRVRRGNFLEAAEFAKAAGDWVMAAAYYEHAGNYLASADIYRQIGDLTAAAWCLEKAGRPREAAFLNLAIGQNERAVKVFLNAIESGRNLEENSPALIELLIQMGKCPQALELLQKKFFARGPNEANAQIFYQAACRFEEQKAWKEAHALYQQMIAAGAQSDDLAEREARAARMVAEMGEIAIAPAAPKPPDDVDLMLMAELRGLVERPTAIGEPFVEAPTTRAMFRFTPGAKALAEAAGEETPISRKTLMLPAQELSLFGRAVGDPLPSYSLDSDGDLLVEIPELYKAEADPFASRQRYKIKAELGRGGMGVVYEALDTLLGRRIALKLIQKESANPEGFEQFLVEARAIALLSHPNVVTIYDIGLMEMQHYIAMEFVDGGSLAGLIKKEKSLSFKEALRLFVEIARGLESAHETGIVHRDIKPENILLTKKNQVKISDFGLAKIRHKSRAAAGKTPYEISGTPGFMAPELIRGDEPHPRFDIYALGITLFTMLVGKPPHETARKTSFLDIVDFQKSGEHIPIGRFRLDTPESVEQLYEYCTAPNPDDRYPSVDAFLPAVEKYYATL